jgi:hypothetical protein
VCGDIDRHLEYCIILTQYTVLVRNKYTYFKVAMRLRLFINSQTKEKIDTTICLFIPFKVWLFILSHVD